MSLTVITPSLIAFLFRITIPIGFRMNFFGMAVEQHKIRTPKLSQQSVVTIRMGDSYDVCVVYVLFMWLYVYMTRMQMHVHRHACECERVDLYVYVCSCILSMSNQKKAQILAAYTWFFFCCWFLLIWLFGYYVSVCVSMCGCLFLFSFISFYLLRGALSNHIGSDEKRWVFYYMYFAWFPIISKSAKLFTAFRPCINFEQLLIERAQEITNNGNEETRE